MGKIKKIFEKISSVFVILYFAYFLFFIKIQKEILSLFEESYKFFWAMVKGSSVAIFLFSFLALIIIVNLINWILDDTKKRNKKIDKEEEKEKIQPVVM